MFQAFFWNADSPGEDPTKPGDGEWYNKITAKVTDLSTSGITRVYLPVPTKGESGVYSMGYDPKDHYDPGIYTNQYGEYWTRFGDFYELTNLTAKLNATNLVPVVDIVMNHMRQDNGSKTFTYVHGTFEKGTNDFHPSPEGHNDELKPYHKTDEFGDTYFDVDQLVPHMREGLKVWGQWLTDIINCSGYRFDLTQRMESWSLYEWLNYPGQRGNFACSEYWRLARPIEMREWIELTGRSTAIWDWYFRDLLYEMCYTNTYNFDISQLTNSLAWSEPDYTVNYVENHDTYCPAKTNVGKDGVRPCLVIIATLLINHGLTPFPLTPFPRGSTRASTCVSS